MNNPIAMPDLGNDVYLRFSLKDIATIELPYQRSMRLPFIGFAKSRLDIRDIDFISSALFYGLKRSDGEYHYDLRARGVPGALDIRAISVPPSTLVARIYQALQQAIL